MKKGPRQGGATECPGWAIGLTPDLSDETTCDEMKVPVRGPRLNRTCRRTGGSRGAWRCTAHEAGVAAERRAGEILKAKESAQGKRTDLVTSCYQVDKSTLSDIGITRMQSSRFQANRGLDLFSLMENPNIGILKTNRQSACDTLPALTRCTWGCIWLSLM